VTYLTFNAEFNAVHRLWNDDLDDATNLALFAECATRHGHQYRVEVTVKAAVSGRKPVVMERGDVQRVIDDVLTPTLQDCDMNTVFGRVNFMSTGENIVDEVWDMVQPALPTGVALAAVRIVSTPNNSFVRIADGEAQRLV